VSQPTTTREALIAEALGDMLRLVDRIEALAPTMDDARQSLVDASADLARQAETFERRMHALTEGAKAETVRHIVRRTEAMTRESLDTQTRAMAEAAQKLFASEIHPALQRLALPLQRLATQLDRPWRPWLTHAATAVASSALTTALVLAFWDL
jgi:hypothetical protein